MRYPGLEGRTALVVGGGYKGMGRSVALTLAREGARVAVGYGTYQREPTRAEAVGAAIAELGGEGLVVAGDATTPEGWQGMVEAVEARFGPVEILVLATGAPWRPRDLPEIPPGDWDRALAAELRSAYLGLRQLLPGMRARRFGRIVLFGGLGADAWPYGPPQAPLDYPLGKAGRHWLVRTLALREFPHGITLNAVAPGPIPRFPDLEAALAAVRGEGPWGTRTRATPQDVAELVAFLCSDLGRFITGAVIPVPGPPEGPWV